MLRADLGADLMCLLAGNLLAALFRAAVAEAADLGARTRGREAGLRAVIGSLTLDGEFVADRHAPRAPSRKTLGSAARSVKQTGHFVKLA